MASTGFSLQESIAFRRNELGGKQLSVEEREQLVKKYLPPEPPSSFTAVPTSPPQTPKAKKYIRRGSQQQQHYRPPKTGFFRHLVHILVYTVISAIFSVYLRFRRAWHLVGGRIFAIL